MVEPLEAEEKTAGGILLPDTRQAEAAARPRPRRRPRQAPRHRRARTPWPSPRATRCIFGQYAGTEIEVDGKEIKILRESDILAKVVK